MSVEQSPFATENPPNFLTKSMQWTGYTVLYAFMPCGGGQSIYSMLVFMLKQNGRPELWYVPPVNRLVKTAEGILQVLERRGDTVPPHVLLPTSHAQIEGYFRAAAA